MKFVNLFDSLETLVIQLKIVCFYLFEAPEPVKSWKPTTFNALEHSNMCTQPGNFMPVSFPQSEDCLSLNIFVPGNLFYLNNSQQKIGNLKSIEFLLSQKHSYDSFTENFLFQ